MSVDDKLITIAENEQKVYEAGKEAAHSEYISPKWTDWRYFDYYGARNSLVAKLKYNDTSKGVRFNHMYYHDTKLIEPPKTDTSNGVYFNHMCAECTALTKGPEIDTSNGETLAGMLANCPNLVFVPLYKTSKCKQFYDMLRGCIRLPEVPEFDTSNGESFNSMLYECGQITEVPEFDTSNGKSFNSMCSGCGNLITVRKINLSNVTQPGNMNSIFNGCYELQNVTFEGIVPILENIAFFSQSPKLTVDSLMSFINALSDNTSLTKTYTVTIGSTNLAKLTEAQKAIATAKNIKLA